MKDKKVVFKRYRLMVKGGDKEFHSFFMQFRFICDDIGAMGDYSNLEEIISSNPCKVMENLLITFYIADNVLDIVIDHVNRVIKNGNMEVIENDFSNYIETKKVYI